MFTICILFGFLVPFTESSFGKCGNNKYCEFIHIHPQETSTYEVAIENKQENAQFHISFESFDYDCFRPRISFKYERIDGNGHNKHISISDDDALIGDCYQNINKCGHFKKCLHYQRVNTPKIRANIPYTITVVQPIEIKPRCYDNANPDYSINAQLTLHCPRKVKCGDSITGSTKSKKDNHWFLLDLTDESPLRMTTIDTRGSYFDTTLVLTDFDGNVIAECDNDNSKNDSLCDHDDDDASLHSGSPFIAKISNKYLNGNDDVYFIGIGSSSNSFGQYQMQIGCQYTTHTPTVQPTLQPTNPPTVEPTNQPIIPTMAPTIYNITQNDGNSNNSHNNNNWMQSKQNLLFVIVPFSLFALIGSVCSCVLYFTKCKSNQKNGNDFNDIDIGGNGERNACMNKNMSNDVPDLVVDNDNCPINLNRLVELKPCGHKVGSEDAKECYKTMTCPTCKGPILGGFL